MKLVQRRGTIALVGDEIDRIARKWLDSFNIDASLQNHRKARDGENYHVTIVRKEEADLASFDLSETFFPRIFDIGIGQVKKCYYVIVYSPDLQAFRKELPIVHFHISLAFDKVDAHGESICKGLNTLITKPNFENIFKSGIIPKQKMLDCMLSHNWIPRNFTNVHGKVWGSAIMTHEEHFVVFREIGITQIISLLEEENEFIHKQCVKFGIKHRFYHVIDQSPMTLEQMDEICEAIVNENNNHHTLIHCVGGVGRTATALACYLMKHCEKSISQCKQTLTSTRKTIFSNSQLAFLKQYDKHCNQENNEKMLPAKFVLMCGYPCSGKSTVSESLGNAFPNVRIVNQDKMGRKECVKQMVASKKEETIIVDRCHLSAAERKEWMELAGVDAKNVVVIFCNIPYEECRWRITRRRNHETIKDGGGEKIIQSLQGKLEPPTLEEGFKEVITLNSEAEVNTYLQKMGCELPESTLEMEQIVKFPRTRHLKNMGAASREDLLMTPSEVNEFLNCQVVVEEKVDGANLGISIKDNKIVVCNRSHFVTSDYHPQFKKLEKWILHHSNELWTLLMPLDEPPRPNSPRVLYGEWVYATHSIAYDALEDYFIAFDVYDVFQEKFWSRQRLERCLGESTTIALAPVISDSREFATVDEIAQLALETPSRFYDGLVEGVVVRKCAGDWLVGRGKIVRADFISGNEHWSKGELKVNQLIIR